MMHLLFLFEGVSSYQHFKQVSEKFVMYTFMYVQELQSWSSFSALGTFLYLIYWEKDVSGRIYTKKETKKYLRGKKKSILGKKRLVPCYNFVLGTKDTQKITPCTQKKKLDTENAQKREFLGGTAKTKGVVADPPLQWNHGDKNCHRSSVKIIGLILVRHKYVIGLIAAA